MEIKITQHDKGFTVERDAGEVGEATPFITVEQVIAFVVEKLIDWKRSPRTGTYEERVSKVV